MSLNGFERRLSAIIAADVAGYSRMMSADEDGVLGRLKTYLLEVVLPAVTGRRGRLVKTTGDGFLAEFPSTSDAFRCALEIQAALAARNEELSAAERMEFRMGINVGDVMIDGGDVFGDGVNIAARLEAMAEPGGICVSARAWEDLSRMKVRGEDMGERSLKNIPRPVRVFHVPAREACRSLAGRPAR